MTVVTARRSLACTLLALVCTPAMLVSCGGSSSSPPGTPVLTLSGTNGDFASYRVNISSISLTDSRGTVSTLPLAAQLVDLVTLTDLSELLGAPAFPSGTYKSASLILDFSSVSVWVNVSGKPVLANPVNAMSAALGSAAVNITFDPNNPLTLTAGKSSRMAIDVDLAASNSIDTSTSPPTVKVRPFLVVTPAPADSRLMRMRGLFVTAQPSASDYIVNTRPLTDQVSAVGAVTVSTDTNTYFDVNGTAYTGAAGLNAMTSLAENTPIAAYGTLADLSGITPGFHATAVYAGYGLETPLADYVNGVVSARSGNTLTLAGVRLLSRLGGSASCLPANNSTFFGSATVTVGSAAGVTQDGVVASGLGLASISVGQQVDVSGQCSIDSSGNLSLDATSSSVCSIGPCLVRLVPTRIWGTLNSATSGTATVDILTLGNFAPAAFNFAGTGTTVADPAAYLVNTGTLDESAVAAGTLLQLDGVVTSFGAAPPDFSASSIAQGSATEQRLVVEWPSGATAPFTSASSSGLAVDLSNVNLGSVHHIRTGPAMLDLKTLPASPLITTVGADQSNLRLAISSAPPPASPSSTTPSSVSVFNGASGFASAVSSTFAGTNKIYRLVAVGQFNAAANTFVASRISVALHE
ncbi:MAG TPA: DUF4382 domain-containing protein [Steroidobacteraceae bacterium]|nr:DUF4382 domain-containing protein [Steroidobacteraceae bacterium]